jgi:hypothetical protein
MLTKDKNLLVPKLWMERVLAACTSKVNRHLHI